MKHFIGIDFGTSNTCISFIERKSKSLKYNNMSVIPSFHLMIKLNVGLIL